MVASQAERWIITGVNEVLQGARQVTMARARTWAMKEATYIQEC
jgi:hypothetical protein